MIKIIKEEWGFYGVFLPLLVAVAVIARPGIYLLIPVFYLYWFSQQKHYLIVLASLIIFVLADNFRLLPAFTEGRYVVLLLCSFFSVQWLSNIRVISLRWLYFIPFFLYALIVSLLYSPVLTESVPRVVSYLLLILNVFVYYKYTFKSQTTRFVLHFHGLFIIYFAITILSFLFPWHPRLFVLGRFAGLMSNPNGLALISLSLFIITDYFQKQVTGKQFTLAWILKAIILVALVLSGSRNALASLFIYVFLSFLFEPRLNSLEVVLSLVFIPVGFLLIDFDLLLQSEVVSNILRIDTLENASGRVEVWEMVMKQIAKEPWWGSGFYYDDFFMNAYLEQANLANDVVARQFSGVWNSYLTLLLNVGVAGGCLLMLFLFSLHQGIELKRLLPFTIALLFSAFFESWLASSLNAYSQFFYLYYAIQQRK